MIQIFILINLKIFLLLFCFGFIIGRLRQYACKNLMKNDHGTLLLDFFNLVGIPIHELSHLLFGLLFGFHIDKVCLYRTIKKSREKQGILGYVKMHHKKNTPFQKLLADLGQFFVGIGPLILEPVVILTAYYLLPDSIKTLFASFSSGWYSIKTCLSQMNHTDFLLLFLFLYSMIGISLNLELSKDDLKLAGKGAIFLEIFVIILSFVFASFNVNVASIVSLLSKYIILISMTGIISSLFAVFISFIGL